FPGQRADRATLTDPKLHPVSRSHRLRPQLGESVHSTNLVPGPMFHPGSSGIAPPLGPNPSKTTNGLGLSTCNGSSRWVTSGGSRNFSSARHHPFLTDRIHRCIPHHPSVGPCADRPSRPGRDDKDVTSYRKSRIY